MIRRLAAYVILGINCEGRKEVLSIQMCENESLKYRLSVLNELRNRGVKDILISDRILARFIRFYQSNCLKNTHISLTMQPDGITEDLRKGTGYEPDTHGCSPAVSA